MSSTLARRLLGLTIVIAIAALTAIIVRFFMESHSNNGRQSAKSTDVDISLKSIHLTESDHEGKIWELFASSGSYDKAKDRSLMENIRFTAERKLTSEPVKVTAKHGEYDHASKHLLLKGNVKAVSRDGISFDTSSITYDSAKRALRTPEKVILKDAAMLVEGKGFSMNLETGVVNLQSDVSAVIYPGRGKR